jgi:hypothetical protein
VAKTPKPRARWLFSIRSCSLRVVKTVGTRFNAQRYDTWQAETGHHRSWT